MRGHIGKCIIIGLPGNPVSTMITNLFYTMPLLLHSMGANLEELEHTRIKILSGFHIKRNPGRKEWIRVRLVESENGISYTKIYPNNGSGIISSMTWATGLVELSESCREVHPGEVVTYLPFSGIQ